MNYIIIRGPLGIGKTTIAKKLAEKLKAEYISIDEILHENDLDKIEGECIPLNNFIKANEIALPQIEKGKTYIIDGNFYHKEQLEHLLKNLPGKHYVFTLKAPVEACIERDAQREKTYGEEAARAVHCLVLRFDYGIIIDTESKSAEEVTEELISAIKI